jgi:hypothetical protein
LLLPSLLLMSSFGIFVITSPLVLFIDCNFYYPLSPYDIIWNRMFIAVITKKPRTNQTLYLLPTSF